MRRECADPAVWFSVQLRHGNSSKTAELTAERLSLVETKQRVKSADNLEPTEYLLQSAITSENNQFALSVVQCTDCLAAKRIRENITVKLAYDQRVRNSDLSASDIY